MTTAGTSTAFDWDQVRRDRVEQVLRRHLEGEVRFDRASRTLYSTDASIYRIEPLGVVIPKNQRDLATVVTIAAEQHLPLVPRGGGTSLSGQAIGPGIVVDCCKYLNSILDINVAAQTAWVEPGVILAHFNRALEPMGMQFGPDVATIDRANLGGMIGNNSAGSRSVRYGKTIDHVLAIDGLLSNGQSVQFAPIAGEPLERMLEKDDREGRIYRTLRRIIMLRESEIRRRFPRVIRRVSGYNLDALLPPNPMDLSRLIVGSEGTLAVVARAKLKIVPRPRCRGIAVVHFATLPAALSQVPAILETNPAAIELIDAMILDRARANPQTRSRIDFLNGNPAAIHVVEYFGHEPDEIDRSFAHLREVLDAAAQASLVTTQDSAQSERIWSIRKMAMPLLQAIPGQRKPITFCEDTAVDPSRLADFVQRFQEILRRHGTEGSFYGHASVGCLHIRPLLDLRQQTGVRDMETIMRQVVDLVLEFGGSLSGEHGDGLCRSYYNRDLFGNEVYEAFREVKHAFDPENLLNPGKIVDAPHPSQNLRDEIAVAGPQRTLLDFSADGGILEVPHRCNGNGMCRREDAGTMCPSYMATREEEHSPRGRANLLRAAMEGRWGNNPEDWSKQEGLAEALDLCLMCKACQNECPTSVDISRLKSEFLYQRSLRRPPSLLARGMAQIRTLNRLGSQWAPFSNWVLRSWPTRWMFEHFFGLDRRRKMPTFERRTLVDWFKRHRSQTQHLYGRVVLLADCFTNHHETRVGKDAVALLEAAGYQVTVAPICCGRTAISKGFLKEAQQLAIQGANRLSEYAEEGIPILGTEPSCLFTLADEWKDLVPGPKTELIAQNVFLVETWLRSALRRGRCDLARPSGEPLSVMVHGHCHQKAANGLQDSVQALEELAAVRGHILNTGCCGMAGSFGYEAKHYDLSVKVAEHRLLPALRNNPEMPVLASGFSCRSQIADLADRRAIHPVELIWRRVAPPSVKRGRRAR